MSEYSILLSGTIKGSRASLFSVKYMGNKNKCQGWTGIFDCNYTPNVMRFLNHLKPKQKQIIPD
jgi:hypothetical protein